MRLCVITFVTETVEGHHNTAREYPKQSKQTQELHSATAATHTSYQVLEAASHIGCMTKDNWLKVQKIQHWGNYMSRRSPVRQEMTTTTTSDIPRHFPTHKNMCTIIR